MTFRSYLIIMAFVSACAWLSWITLVHTLDPTQIEWIGFFLFYFTLGIAILPTITLIGTVIRVWRYKNERIHRQVLTSLRQGLLVTLLFLLTLFLLGRGLLTWWVILLLITLIAVVEFLCVDSKSHLNTK